MLQLLIFILILGFFSRFKENPKFNFVSYLALISAFTIFNIHFLFTSANDYMYDIEAHKELINHFSKNWWPQKIGESWLSYHPPFYYYVEACFLTLERFFKISSFELVRYSNILLYLGFQIFSILSINILKVRTQIKNVAVFTIAFFPIGDIYSNRINNDSLLYPLWAGSIYYFLRWEAEHRPLFLKLCIALLALAIITKANAYLLLISFFLYFIANFLNQENKKTILINNLKKYKLFLALIVAAISLTSGRVIAIKLFINPKTDLMVANYTSKLEMEGNPIVLRLPTFSELHYFFKPPFPETFDKNSNGRIYSIHLFKTFFYGEWHRAEPTLALFINGVALLTGTLLILSLFLVQPIHHQVLSYCLMVPLVGHFINTLTKPVVCTSDARYIFPILLPLVLILAEKMEIASFDTINWVRYLGRAIFISMLLFSSLSFTFLVSQHLFN